MDIRGYIDENAAGFFGALRQWLAIPSISALPAHRDDVLRSAEWLAGYLRQAGFPLAEVWETGPGGGPEADLTAVLGAPLVFLAVGLDSDRIHAPNERVSMPLLLKGAESAAYLWDEFAAVADDLTAAR